MRFIKRKKSIIFVSHDAMFFGAQLLSLNIIKSLSYDFGFDVYTILINDGELYSKFKKFSKSIICLNKINDKKLDKWIINSGASRALINTVISGSVINRLSQFNINCISLLHEMKSIVKNYNAEDSLNNIIKHSNKIVVASNFVYKSLNSIHKIPKNKIIIQPQGLFNDNPYFNDFWNTRNKIRKKYNINYKDKVVLAMGYGDYRKGVDIFTNVCRNVCDRLDNVVFMWVGDLEAKMYETIQPLIDSYNINKKIIFVGNQEDHTKYYIAADVFLLTSREDPFPSVVMEAMDAGLPIVCFKDGGGYVDVINKNNGVVVEMENGEQMAHACIEIINNNEALWNRSEIHSYARKCFNFKKYVGFLVSLLDT